MGPDLAIAAYRFKPTLARPEAVAKVAACYDYQSCEHEAYKASDARQIYLALAEAYPSTLPGYDNMPWGIASGADLMRAMPAKPRR